MAKTSYIIVDKKKIARDINLAGGKAKNLATLSRAGFHVPEFFVVSTDTFKTRHFSDPNRFNKKLAAQLARLQTDANDLFAARSSSPLEDQVDHSFAGQYDSFLNLRTLDEILDSVRRVWDSAEKQTPARYSENLHGASHQPIAVVVQKMIQAVVSGVLFTAHPVENDPNMMLLEIVDGGCDNLVSGKKNPVTIRIDTNDFSFHVEGREQLSAFMQAFIDHPDGLNKLLASGQDIAKVFNSPQDIEWAFDGHQTWILQSRPISTLAQNNPAVFVDKDGRKWSSYFFSERFMQPLSPLGWSFLKPIIQKTALQEPLWYLGLDDVSARVQLKLIDGLPYANLDAYQNLYSFIPLALISQDKKETLELDRRTQKRIGIRHIFSLFCRLIFVDWGWFPPANLRHWHNFQVRIERLIEARLDKLEQKNLKECRALFDETHAWSLQFLEIHRWSITFADIFAALLKNYLKSVYTDAHTIIEKLVSGLPDNATVQANRALLTLDPGNKDALTKFIRRFGHRSESLDVGCATWGEDADHIKKMSDSLKTIGHEFLEHQKRNVQDREQATHECRAKLFSRYRFSGRLRVHLFNLILYYVQQFTTLRENQRNLWQKILRISRLSALRMGKEFVDAGIIADKNDVFFLTCREVGKLVKDRASLANANDLIRVRKMRLTENQKKTTMSPGTLRGAGTMQGIGVSAGRAQGRVRIATNYSQAMLGERGDILVVPSADPAWSPIFAIVSGLVMERGGILSHASIVAREFRLPTLTSVANATKKLNDGDLVEIDGSAGVLRVLSE